MATQAQTGLLQTVNCSKWRKWRKREWNRTVVTVVTYLQSAVHQLGCQTLSLGPRVGKTQGRHRRREHCAQSDSPTVRQSTLGLARTVFWCWHSHRACRVLDCLELGAQRISSSSHPWKKHGNLAHHHHHHHHDQDRHQGNWGGRKPLVRQK